VSIETGTKRQESGDRRHWWARIKKKDKRKK